MRTYTKSRCRSPGLRTFRVPEAPFCMKHTSTEHTLFAVGPYFCMAWNPANGRYEGAPPVTKSWRAPIQTLITKPMQRITNDPADQAACNTFEFHAALQRSTTKSGRANAAVRSSESLTVGQLFFAPTTPRFLCMSARRTRTQHQKFSASCNTPRASSSNVRSTSSIVDDHHW